MPHVRVCLNDSQRENCLVFLWREEFFSRHLSADQSSEMLKPDYEMVPTRIPWRMRIAAVVWIERDLGTG